MYNILENEYKWMLCLSMFIGVLNMYDPNAHVVIKERKQSDNYVEKLKLLLKKAFFFHSQ